MVSLAEKYDLRPAADETVAPVQPNSLDNILRLALNGGRARTAARSPSTPGTAPNFEAAVEVLDRAAQALNVLQSRCEQLEQDLASERQRFTSELQAASGQSKEWERRATSVKAQLYDSESLLTEAELRADAATRRAEAAEARVAVAEQRASETAEQARVFHDKIMGAFGARV